LVKKDYKFCNFQSFVKPNCAGKDKETKLVNQELVVPNGGDKV